jgi:hypothetical protein
MLIVIEYTHAAMDGFLREDDAANSIPTHWVSTPAAAVVRLHLVLAVTAIDFVPYAVAFLSLSRPYLPPNASQLPHQ